MRKKQMNKTRIAALFFAVLFLCQTLAAGIPTAAADQAVKIQRADTPYYYSDYGFGSMFTYKYTVKYGDIHATAYCVEPSKLPPGSGEYTVKKLSDGKNLAKVCYYGTKASGDESFFSQDSEYGELSAGARFILVHLAASYANGSSDAFSGASEAGKNLAMKLYRYCIAQPDIPDVEMSFSASKLTAYLDGTTQRTKKITFQADAQQTIAMKLPKGVKLHNVSAGKTSAAGAEVELCGGTEFYLSAPLTQAAEEKPVWSATMKGSITKDFSAYKVSTGENQDLAFVFGDGVEDEKYVSLEVSWLEPAQISLRKKDADSQKGVAGAVYGIYTDAACENLAVKMPKTDAGGSSAAKLMKTQETFYVREISVPEGYLLDETVYPVKVGDRAEVTVDVTEKQVRGEIVLKKVDAQTGTYESQGDAALSGAVYGLYAKKEIVHPDGHTGVLYPAGTLVAKQTFGKSGEVRFSNLYLGSYYVKELEAPEGYLLDAASYDVTLNWEGNQKELILKNLTVREAVKRQSFQLIKVSTDGANGETMTAEGAEFTVKLAREVETSGWEKAAVRDVLTTDAGGHAKSKELPYGKYLIRETKTPAGMLTVRDFTVVIREDSREPQSWRVFNDAPYQAYIRFVKKDAVSGETVCIPGASFQIQNTKTGETVTQNVGGAKVDTFTTDADGTVTTPLMLAAGNYAVTEIAAPAGYLINTEEILFSIGGVNQVLPTDEDGNPILEIVAADEPVTGTVRIRKIGEQLSSLQKSDDGMEVQYTDGILAGAAFQLVAAENIYTPDGQKNAEGERCLAVYNGVVLKKGAVAARLVTDAEGNASAEGLPLGTYRLQETATADGFICDTAEKTVTLSYQDQETPVVYYDRTYKNQRIRTKLMVKKKDSLDNTPVQGAVYGIFNAENITVGERILVEKDTLLEQAVTDASGQLTFQTDFPLGSYYVKELQTPSGYLLDEKSYEVDFRKTNIQGVTAAAVLEVFDSPVTVEIAKIDTEGNPVPGAQLEVLDSDGQRIASWKSGEKPHRITALAAGTYTLRETAAARGYICGADKVFRVRETAEIQKVSMCNRRVQGRVLVQKTDRDSGEALAGVQFELRDAAGNLLERLETDERGEAQSKLYEIASFENGKMKEEKTYTLTEVKTQTGYQLDETSYPVVFAYENDETPVVEKKLFLKNAKLPQKSTGPKTGDLTMKGWWICLTASMWSLFVILSKRDSMS